MQSLLGLFDRSPVTSAVMVAYLLLAFSTDPIAPESAALVSHGAAVGVLVQDGEPWRLLTYAFLHGGLIHLLFNGYCLVMIGPGLEARLGSARFLLLYAIAAVGGGVAAVLWQHPVMPLVGGSGALFGMFGSALALNMRGGRHLLDFLNYRGPRTLVSLIIVNLVLGWLMPMVSNAAHIGGLVAGFVLTFLFLDRGRRPQLDVVGRAVQLGWIALFVSLTCYCTTPVARWDYHWRRYHQATSAEDRARWAPLVHVSGILQEEEHAPPWLAARVVRWKGR
jgi:rhomboid protease GluP